MRGPAVSDAAVRFPEYGTSDELRIVDLLGGLGSDVAGAVDQVDEGVTVVRRAAGPWPSAPGRESRSTRF